MARETRPLELLSVGDGIFLTVGMIIGALIFKAPSMVAGATSGPWPFLLAWLLGGAISLCGALVYAELASRHPHTGGEYVFLNEGMGRGVAFLFAWSRMTVIQTGAIAAVAFVFGDYASEIFSFGKHSSALWAAGGVIVLTALNFAGTLQSKTLQKVMETVLITGLVLFSVAAIVIGGPAKPAAGGGSGSFGFAMIFVLLAYGGWNEAAYLAGEVRDARRNMTRILVWGVIAVTALYLLVNVGYLAVLGHGGIRESKVAAGAATPDGFNAMVAYTSPVFWTFMYLVASSLFLIRDRAKDKAAFRVPLFPHIPFVFSMACLYMLYSSIDYVRNPDYGPKFGWAVGAGLLVMAAGIPLYFASRKA